MAGAFSQSVVLPAGRLTPFGRRNVQDRVQDRRTPWAGVAVRVRRDAQRIRYDSLQARLEGLILDLLFPSALLKVHARK